MTAICTYVLYTELNNRTIYFFVKKKFANKSIWIMRSKPKFEVKMKSGVDSPLLFLLTVTLRCVRFFTLRALEGFLKAQTTMMNFHYRKEK